eukprot:Anaeramoba_ignava/c20294_g1_i2.p2 GENE.c20294_g1_i2~~c20294_g1_i2.p2  ORF type:complete len:196 (+),score=46.80 c20294_g1_i2:47-589(+)
MAEHFAKVHGSEQDKINCPFYHKVGICRHGDFCIKRHNVPIFSRTILLRGMYTNPRSHINPTDMNPEIEQELQKHLDLFYTDVFSELSKYGEVEELMVTDNLAPHLLGHVFVRYITEDDAEKAYKSLQGRFYNSIPLKPEYSPVADFRDARCKQYDNENEGCQRGDFCNFLHVRDLFFLG